MLQNVAPYQLYTYSGDLCTIGLSILCLIFFRSSYKTHEKNAILFRNASGIVLVAAIISIFYHGCLINGAGSDVVVWLLHDTVYNLIIYLLAIFIIYISNIVKLSKRNIKITHSVSFAIATLHMILQVVAHLVHIGFWIERDSNNNRIVHESYWGELYVPFYLILSGMLLYVFIKCRNRLVSNVFYTIAAVIATSYSLVVVQSFRMSTVFLCFSFILPITASLFLFHYNPYDITTGALDSNAFSYCVHNSKNTSTAFIFLQMDFAENMENEKLSTVLFKFSERYFKGTYAFKLNDNLMVFAVKKTANIDFENKFEKLLSDAKKLYNDLGISYKFVLIDVNDSCSNAKDYVDLANSLLGTVRNTGIYRAKESDYEKYKRTKYIVSQIRDIEKNENLDDERVLVYCQPVLDTRLGYFTTAEALMRLKLPELGMVYPDEFIPIAERYNLIHTLTRIILHKTCKEIKHLDDNGFRIDRISINCSMIELKDAKFCEDIIEIIDNAGTQYDQVALELTESNSEADFEITKKIINVLRHCGIKFYLDDFGTGYSNFSRILGLPIDVIKFDRSLTVLSGSDEESKYMVNSFSDIFAKAQYQVLYEGVENDDDEMRCKSMNALYLQGYKYSKPIPIENLKGFLQKKATG